MANYKLPCDEQGCYPPHPPHPEPHPNPVTILKCGTGSGISLPVGNNVLGGNGSSGYGYVPQVVGTVNIDTSRLHDITKKIEFSSLINFKAEYFFSFSLVFQLSAICNGGYKQPLGTWTYEKQVELDYDPAVQANNLGPFELDFDFKDPFCFSWCECDECPECCRFIVEVVDFRSCNVECASITNVSISAMAVGTPGYK